ncbi:lipase member M-like isoform X1 [Notechis scutatus]|uniref:Lipase n=1 Tax=Notechis scutatus TaxID=8663 RepID=A0A6J1VRG9_9SAUR|nr:lipase member M-like isoform X1 [Notechis scutatus]
MRRVKEKKATLICFTMWMLIAMTATQGNLSSEEVNGKTFMNPESFMNISERIRYWGYCCEEYDILTEDGYYLNMNRILGGSKSAILLMHGLILEGSVWISNLPHQSLGFILADAGYDVWIGNYRGNSWSRRHKHLSVNETEFWNFSFHEMGIYDLSAMTEFILQKTGQQKIFYAGHAVGSLIAYVGFSVLPHLAEKIKMFFALGPAYTLQKAISPVLQILRLPEVLIKFIFGQKEFSLLSRSKRAALTQQCGQQLSDELCRQALSLISGFNLKNLNKSRSDVYISHFPDYTSVKHIIHLGQLMKSGLFRYFDYGLKNKDIYHQKTPPFYRIEAITVPVAIWSGGQDWVCRPNEIAQLWSRTTNLVYNKGFPDWTHWDFIWGIDAHQRAYKDILGLMEKYL